MSRLLEVERFVNDKDKFQKGYGLEIKKCHSQRIDEEVRDTYTK